MNDTVEVEISINETVNVEVSVHSILSAVNELPLTLRWNVVAKIINYVDVDDKDLSPEQKDVIIEWLRKKVEIFK